MACKAGCCHDVIRKALSFVVPASLVLLKSYCCAYHGPVNNDGEPTIAPERITTKAGVVAKGPPITERSKGANNIVLLAPRLARQANSLPDLRHTHQVYARPMGRSNEWGRKGCPQIMSAAGVEGFGRSGRMRSTRGAAQRQAVYLPLPDHRA